MEWGGMGRIGAWWGGEDCGVVGWEWLHHLLTASDKEL